MEFFGKSELGSDLVIHLFVAAHNTYPSNSVFKRLCGFPNLRFVCFARLWRNYTMYRTKYKQNFSNPFIKKARLQGLIICFLWIKLVFLATFDFKTHKKGKKNDVLCGDFACVWSDDAAVADPGQLAEIG
jgi:hypothetical protein